MTTTGKLMTAEELAALPHDSRRYELLDGVLRELPLHCPEHDYVRTLVALAITPFVRANKLGYVLTGDTGYILRRDPDRVRSPDVSFLSHERMQGRKLSQSYSPTPPDLLVEIIECSDLADELDAKIMEWLAFGVRLVLVLYPDTRSVMAYRSPTDVRRYTDADTLDVEPVLPGFACPVAQLFPEAQP